MRQSHRGPCLAHTAAPEAGKAGKPDVDVATQGGGNKNKNKKKAGDNNQSLAGAPTAAATPIATGGGRGPHNDKRPRQASDNDDGDA
jgi:hypothetical protein